MMIEEIKMSRKDELYHYGVKGMKWGKRKAIREYLDAKKKGALDRSAKANALKRQAEKIASDQQRAREGRMGADKWKKLVGEQRAEKARKQRAEHKALDEYFRTPPSERYFDKDHPEWTRNHGSRGVREEARNRYRSKSSATNGQSSRSYMQDARENVDAIRDNIKNRQTDPDWSNTRWNAKQAVRNTAKAGKTAARSFIKKLRKKKR